MNNYYSNEGFIVSQEWQHIRVSNGLTSPLHDLQVGDRYWNLKT